MNLWPEKFQTNFTNPPPPIFTSSLTARESKKEKEDKQENIKVKNYVSLCSVKLSVYYRDVKRTIRRNPSVQNITPKYGHTQIVGSQYLSVLYAALAFMFFSVLKIKRRWGVGIGISIKISICVSIFDTNPWLVFYSLWRCHSTVVQLIARSWLFVVTWLIAKH